MPTPSLLQAATEHNWVSSIDSVVNILKPSIDSELVKRYGDQNMTGFLEMQGATNPVSQLQYTHFEEDFLHDVVIATGTAGAANAAVTYTIIGGYTYTYPLSAQAPYIVALPSTLTNPVLKQQVLRFPNGTEGIVDSVNYAAGTFVAYPTVLGTNLPTTTSASKIVITGNAHGEGTDQPLSRNSRVIRYTNNMQIFKATHKTTGSALGEQIWFQVEGLNGTKGFLWYYKGQFDEEKRFKNEKEVSLVVGNKITNNAAVIGFSVQPGQESTITSEGLIPFIENNGNITTYSLITGLTLADFETMIATQLDKNRGAKENTLWCGINVRQSIDRFMRAEMKEGGISYGAFNGDQKKAISFNFDSFQLTGYTFHMKTYDVFNYPNMLGATGQPYVNMALVVPADNVVTSLGENKTKTTVPSLRINYLSQKGAGGSYDRLMETWLTGGANGIYTNNVDSIQYNLRSHCGFEGFSPNRYCKIINS